MYRNQLFSFLLVIVFDYYFSHYHTTLNCYAWVTEKSLSRKYNINNVVVRSVFDSGSSYSESRCPREDHDNNNENTLKEDTLIKKHDNDIRKNDYDSDGNDDDDDDDDGRISHMVWTHQSSSPSTWMMHNNKQSSSSLSVQETLRWCHNIVLPLNLCPWAKGSLESSRAMQFYGVKDRNDMMDTTVIEDVAQLFHQRISERKGVDPVVAIDFLVCEDLSWEFSDFFYWFSYIEEEYWGCNPELHDKVTLAAFHPNWSYNDEDDIDESLQLLEFEKKTPYPTVTFVSTEVVEAVSEDTTNRIAEKNEETLLQKNVQEMKSLYQNHVYIQNNNNNRKES